MSRNAEAYRKALRLHKLSWHKRQEGKAKWFWQKDTFDDSHIPELYKDVSYWQEINDKLESFVRYDNMENGKFKATLNIDEAITLLTKTNYDNIHYFQEADIDLNSYKLRANVFKITVI